MQAMGIEERAAQLVKRAMEGGVGRGVGGEGEGKEGLTEVVRRVESGWRRLVDKGEGGMGGLYHVMAIVPFVPSGEGKARRRPVGFGGDVKF